MYYVYFIKATAVMPRLTIIFRYQRNGFLHVDRENLETLLMEELTLEARQKGII